MVSDGPLKGLDFLTESAEGCHIYKLLSCNEQPLLPYIKAAIQANYPLYSISVAPKVNYAVGMARHMLDTRVLAFDLNLNEQQVCKNLAEKNGVADRIITGALFKVEDFAAYAGARGGIVRY